MRRIISIAQRFNSNIPKNSDKTINTIKQNKMFSDVKELYEEMERRKYNTRYIGIGIGLSVIFLFYNIITDWLSDQAADVTSKYLENPKFKKDVLIFIEHTVNELSKSEKIQNDVKYLLENAIYDLADNEKVKDKLTNLFVDIFKSEAIKNAGSELSDDVIKKLIHSPEYESMRNELVEFVIVEINKIVKNDELQKNVGMASWNAFKVWFGVNPENITVSKV